MKKTKIMTVASIIILGILTTVHAASASVQFNGDNEVTAEREQTITLEISNNEAIGVITGVISYDSNIKDVKVNSSYNGWMITYNETTGQFNAIKAEGTTKGEVLQIIYKLNGDATQGSITLKDVELTTIAYETIKIDNNITKTINKKIENNNSEDANQNQLKQDQVNDDKSDKKITTSANVTKTASRKHTKKRSAAKNR